MLPCFLLECIAVFISTWMPRWYTSLRGLREFCPPEIIPTPLSIWYFDLSREEAELVWCPPGFTVGPEWWLWIKPDLFWFAAWYATDKSFCEALCKLLLALLVLGPVTCGYLMTLLLLSPGPGPFLKWLSGETPVAAPPTLSLPIGDVFWVK